jgi:5-methylthioadenosine/S-adenosylhomocysteine deaminase
MSRGRVGVYLGVAILVVALCWGRGLDAGERSNPGGPGYLIRNASVVLTMDPTLGHGILGQIENADVLIVGDRIAAVGSLGRRPPGVQVIDGRGMIVMPGFVDTHDHLWQSVIRGCATDANVDGWFTRCGSPLFQYRFSESDAYAIVRLSTTGLIGTGVTTVVDWSHAFNADFVRGNLLALNDSGLRYAFAMGVPTASDGPDVKAAKAEFIDPNPLGTLQVAGRVSVTPGVLKEEPAPAQAVMREERAGPGSGARLRMRHSDGPSYLGGNHDKGGT